MGILDKKPKIRNRNIFQLFSIDTSKKWLDYWQKQLPEIYRNRVHFCFSNAKIGTYNGQLCHFYSKLPDIIADFFYLDGPNPKDVKGRINGLSFQCEERTAMAADLLLIESTFLPGTFILIDGRVNNARFLERNFMRNYQIVMDQENDYTTFELQEPVLGKNNRFAKDFI